MSLTPDLHFNGESTCSCCNKVMYVNDTGVVFRPESRIIEDFLFCVECAVRMTMSMAQDISNVRPDLAFVYYDRFPAHGATVSNMRRHAESLRTLAKRMDGHAEMIEQFGR